MDGPALLTREFKSTIAAISFARSGESTVVTELLAGDPLKLLIPRHGKESAWAIASNFGGGLLAGDSIDLKVRVHTGASAMLGTQGSTRIYRSGSRLPARQTLNATIDDDALLVLLPDPVVCFADSKYEQRQRFDLAPNASLVLLDWYTSGRLARGERWAMSRYLSVSSIHQNNRPLIHDALRLDRTDEPIDHSFKTGRFNCFATAYLAGPKVAPYVDALRTEVDSIRLSKRADLLISAADLGDGMTVLRIAGIDLEGVAHALKNHLRFVTTLLKDDPWIRKW